MERPGKVTQAGLAPCTSLGGEALQGPGDGPASRAAAGKAGPTKDNQEWLGFAFGTLTCPACDPILFRSSPF